MLTFDDCIAVARELSRSQGFYGRLLRAISELSADELANLKADWTGKFSDPLDFILYLET